MKYSWQTASVPETELCLSILPSVSSLSPTGCAKWYCCINQCVHSPFKVRCRQCCLADLSLEVKVCCPPGMMGCVSVLEDCAWAQILDGINAGGLHRLSSPVLFLCVYQCLDSGGALALK